VWMRVRVLLPDAQQVTHSVLQGVALCCSVVQCVAVCCSVLQCVAECCSVLQRVAVWMRVYCSVDASPCIALWRPACHLLCVTGCCSVLQFVEVFTECCSVLQCVAVYGLSPPYMRMVIFVYGEREKLQPLPLMTAK